MKTGFKTGFYGAWHNKVPLRIWTLKLYGQMVSSWLWMNQTLQNSSLISILSLLRAFQVPFLLQVFQSFFSTSMCEDTGSKHRVHTEWQRLLSGAHSIMMEKLAHAGEGVGCTSTPFYYIYYI
jgi:hypothetical protein